jgi:hypothetical protein
MAGASTLRADVAARLTAELGAAGVTVYPAGADVVAVPAVTINPGDPYIVPTSFGATPDATILAVGLELWLVVGRPGDPEARLGELEALRKQVTDALYGWAPVGMWAEFGAFGVIEVGGVEHAAGRLEYVFKVNDQ